MTKPKRLPQKLGPARVPINLKKLGPAMRALPNDKWRAACVARFHVKSGRLGGNTAAVRAAGFGSETTTPDAMKVIAFRVFHDPRMQAALHEVGEAYIKMGVPDALVTVTEIMNDPRQSGTTRLKAAEVFIDRHHPVQTAHHVVVEHVDDRRMAEFAIKLAQELGIEAGKLIGRVDGKLIEHES
jgi:hypothetical protein